VPPQGGWVPLRDLNRGGQARAKAGRASLWARHGHLNRVVRLVRMSVMASTLRYSTPPPGPPPAPCMHGRPPGPEGLTRSSSSSLPADAGQHTDTWQGVSGTSLLPCPALPCPALTWRPPAAPPAPPPPPPGAAAPPACPPAAAPTLLEDQVTRRGVDPIQRT
jgi:hypothetical protein